jgi:chromosome segregation ATPase
LSGCATTRDCDPHVDPGFFGSINCLSSGAYESRMTDQQKMLDREQKANSDLARQAKKLEQTRMETDTALHDARADLDKMDAQLETMRNALSKSQKTNKELQSKIATYRSKIAHLKGSVNHKDYRAAERDRLRKAMARTQDEMQKTSDIR